MTLLSQTTGKMPGIIKKKHNLDNIMRWHNNNVGLISARNLLKLVSISFREGKFVVKTHEGPTRFMRLLLGLGLLKVVYIYRDPRDVVLSAMDHGNRILEKGERHTFAAMTTFDSAVNALQGWLKVWESYAKLGRVHMVKYEDLMSDPFGTMRSLCSYL